MYSNLIATNMKIEFNLHFNTPTNLGFNRLLVAPCFSLFYGVSSFKYGWLDKIT